MTAHVDENGNILHANGFEPDEAWEALDPQAQEQAIIDDSLARIQELKLDPERIAATMGGFLEAGVDPIDALQAATEAHDLSEAADEMQALERISAREGWK